MGSKDTKLIVRLGSDNFGVFGHSDQSGRSVIAWFTRGYCVFATLCTYTKFRSG